MSLALAVVVVGLGLVRGLVGTVLDSADGAIELVADGVAVLGLLLVGAALGLLGVAGELVGSPVDVVLDGVDGGLNEAPGCMLAKGSSGRCGVAQRGQDILALSVGVGRHGDWSGLVGGTVGSGDGEELVVCSL